MRCFVVGNRVAAAIHRQAPEGDFRANLHRGGIASAVELTSQETEVAIRAAAIMGLGVAGVDLLRSRRGSLVLEVNASPGLEGIEKVGGKNIACEIVAHIEQTLALWKSQAKPSG